MQPVPVQTESEQHAKAIEEKTSRALLKNTMDPLLSRLTKVNQVPSPPKSLFAEYGRHHHATSGFPPPLGLVFIQLSLRHAYVHLRL